MTDKELAARKAAREERDRQDRERDEVARDLLHYAATGRRTQRQVLDIGGGHLPHPDDEVAA